MKRVILFRNREDRRAFKDIWRRYRWQVAGVDFSLKAKLLGQVMKMSRPDLAGDYSGPQTFNNDARMDYVAFFIYEYRPVEIYRRTDVILMRFVMP